MCVTTCTYIRKWEKQQTHTNLGEFLITDTDSETASEDSPEQETQESSPPVADAAADDTKTDSGDEEETLQLGGKNTSLISDINLAVVGSD